MKKNIYEILKQSFYEINQHYLKYISAFALQIFLFISALLFLPPFGIVLAFLIAIITQIGFAKYSISILSKQQEQVAQIVQFNKYTLSHIITFIIKTFQIAFFSLFLIVPGFMKWLEYSQADFVLAQNPKLDTSQTLLESKKLTHNSKGRVLMLFVAHAFLCVVLIAFSASVVLLTSAFIPLSHNLMLTWFSVMSIFLLFILALPYCKISRTLLYENLKTLNKFNKAPEKSFMEEVAQEFMSVFKPKTEKENPPEIKTENSKPLQKNKTATSKSKTSTLTKPKASSLTKSSKAKQTNNKKNSSSKKNNLKPLKIK